MKESDTIEEPEGRESGCDEVYLSAEGHLSKVRKRQ